MQQSAVREICRITEVRSAGVVQAHYRYGTYGKTVTYTDGAGSEYLFEKDSYGLLTEERDRLGNKRTYRYSKEDELAEAEQRNGAVRSVTRVKGSEITTYKDGNRYEIVKDITGQVIYEKGLDGHGKCTSEVRYRYDATRRLYVRVQSSCPVLHFAKLGTASPPAIHGGTEV